MCDLYVIGRAHRAIIMMQFPTDSLQVIARVENEKQNKASKTENKQTNKQQKSTRKLC